MKFTLSTIDMPFGWVLFVWCILHVANINLNWPLYLHFHLIFDRHDDRRCQHYDPPKHQLLICGFQTMTKCHRLNVTFLQYYLGRMRCGTRHSCYHNSQLLEEWFSWLFWQRLYKCLCDSRVCPEFVHKAKLIVSMSVFILCFKLFVS